jgi:FimV-like protein
MRPLLIISSLLVFNASANSEDYWETVFKNTEEARLRASQIHQPLDDAQTSSKFGMRFHPILNVDKLHRGVDFAAEHGVPFKAAGKGIVLYAEERGDLGLAIAIEHSNGFVTRYGHASKLLVQAGDYVEDQMIIGLVGDTGIATNSHLHFETIRDGVHVDPSEITTLYNPNDNFTSLDDSINSLLSKEQIETLEQSGYHIPKLGEVNFTDDEPSTIVLEPVDELEVGDESALIAVASIEHEEPAEVTDIVQTTTQLEIDKQVKQDVNTLPNQEVATPSVEPVVLDKNKSTWAIAQDMVKKTDLTIFQALLAIYELNPNSFKYDNIHLRTVDAPALKLPTMEQIASQNPDSAKDRCYADLEKLKLLSPKPQEIAQQQI